MKKRPVEPKTPPPESVIRQIRVPMIRKATVVHAGRTEEVYTIDIGFQGVFVEWRDPLPVGESVDVTFGVPENELPVSARCRVAWYHSPDKPLPNKNLPGGLGLQFVEISESDVRKVREHVLTYWHRHPKARAFHPAWPVGIDQRREGSG